MAGWAPTERSFNRSSGNTAAVTPSSRVWPTSISSAGAADASTFEWRAASMSRRRAAARSHASGLSGIPARGHASSADTSASPSASSAAATSRQDAARWATSLPYDVRAASSAARSASISSSCPLHREVGAYLDAAARDRRAAGRPVERLIEAGHLDHVVASELLLRVGERPVLHLSLAVPKTHRGGKRRRLEPRAADHHPGVGQRLRVRAVRAPVGVLARGVRAGAEVGRVLVDQDRVFHRLSLLASYDERRPGISTGRRAGRP